MASGRDSFSGCGCFLAIIVVASILGGIRSCVVSLINGDNPLPSFGSSKVSGGSGGYGTSNGYNVKYKNTTSPNYNSSQKDYSYTDQYPTEQKEGSESRSQKTDRDNTIDSMIRSAEQSMLIDMLTRAGNAGTQKEITITCVNCNGTGEVKYVFSPMDGFDMTCPRCGRKDYHAHEKEKCTTCDGTGEKKVQL